jgi:hypothetical protein
MTVWVLYDEITNSDGFSIEVFSTKEKAYARIISRLNYEDYPETSKEELINYILADDFEGLAVLEKEII